MASGLPPQTAWARLSNSRASGSRRWSMRREASEAEHSPLRKQLGVGIGAVAPELPGAGERLVRPFEVVAGPAGVADVRPAISLSARPQILLARHLLGDGQGQIRQVLGLAGVVVLRPQARRAHLRRQGGAPGSAGGLLDEPPAPTRGGGAPARPRSPPLRDLPPRAAGPETPSTAPRTCRG